VPLETETVHLAVDELAFPGVLEIVGRLDAVPLDVLVDLQQDALGCPLMVGRG
jgi:hypothetical protein